MSIRLGPPENRLFLAVHSESLFSDLECDAIIGTLEDDRWNDARVSSATDSYGIVDARMRSVASQPLPVRLDGWPMSQVVDAIVRINGNAWRYALHSISQPDYPSVLLYDSQSQDHFARHIDAGETAATRKLSYSVQLSAPTDYVGGDLLVGGSNLQASRARGTLNLFSSVNQHEVTPVISGQRLAIVGWIHGPTFQ